MNKDQVTELLLQSLEHERGGTKVYETALKCALNPELAEEWQKYLEQTRKHEQVLRQTCETLGIDPEETGPGREIVREMGRSLVSAMEMALGAGDPEAAQLVACECVVLAETKDHLDWELIGRVAEKTKGEMHKALKAAYDEVEDEEDEHLYHSKGWCRELWIESLGMRPMLPPPEEKQHVKTALGAARAEQQRKRTM
jgi:rubrerythrin